MIVNGKRVLGCITRLRDLDQPVEVQPLTPFPVIGDLAIDPSPMYADFPDDATILRQSEAHPDAVAPDELPRPEGMEPAFVRFENCIECGLCEAVCPALMAAAGGPGGARKFRGPAALAAFSREIENHPAREEELLAKVDGPYGVWGCDRALQCSLTCPLGVAPARHIAVLQRRIERRKPPV